MQISNVYHSGYYCESPGLTQVTANCSAGYYCPPGQSVPEPPDYICPVGDYCPEGSPQPLFCPRGTYSFLEGMSTCQVCLSRYYCDPTEASADNTSGIFDPVPCPAGHYCPAGTETKYQFPCPSGTYDNIGELETDCKYCTTKNYPVIIIKWFYHLRNKFHFSEVHGSMNAMGHMQSK